MDVFFSYLINSGVSKELEKDNPKYLFGMTGLELVHQVFEKMGIKEEIKPFTLTRNSIKQYWCGYILAYYQYQMGYSFSFIHSAISMNDILMLFDPLHEASEDKVVDTINGLIDHNNNRSRLQQKRKIVGLSQRELANISGVSLRTLQEYEIKQKDIKKASLQTVKSLANALECDIDSIID